jgi:lysophospholipase L1-like esterase
MRHTLFIALLFLLSVSRPAMARDFALLDGDVVVFMGDSITAERTYGKIVEDYTLLRFPDRHVRFINAGKGGESAQDGLRRLERDVFAQGATVLTVAFGVNDIGWGMKADEHHRKLYLDAIRGIVTRCRERGVRVYICSAALTGADPHKSESDFLQKMCDEGMEISRSLGGEAIDIQRTMREIGKRIWDANAATTEPRARASLHEADTIHLNHTGQIAMAYAMLKGLGAPAEVSSATLDAARGALVSAIGCEISDLTTSAAGVSFVRMDQGWPLNLGLIGHLANRWIPLQDELGRYMLAIHSLAPGRFQITVDGRRVGEYTHTQLDHGVNLGSATPDPWLPGGPWDVQATLLRELTDARSRIAYTPRLLHHLSPGSSAASAMDRDTRGILTDLETLQRQTARTRPLRFVVEQTAED